MSQRHLTHTFADIFGRDPEDENENANEDNLDEDDLDEDDEDEDEEDTVESLKEQLATAKKEYDKVHRRMRRADQAKATAEKKLADITNADQNALAEAQAEIERLQGEIASLKGEDTRSLIREEFRDSELVKWHNPKLAFDLLDLEEIEVENGKVIADTLEDAIKALAKDHPYLVKTESQSDEDEDDEEEDKPKRRSGNPHGSRKNRDKRSAALASKYGISGRI